ncbi:cation-translocating P-type ATPase [Actinacidiphila acididurans]|nr:cation-translocating P-type ATPase [Actinacidiphila acididurans]
MLPWSGLAPSMAGLVAGPIGVLGSAARDAAERVEHGSRALLGAVGGMPADLVEAVASLADAGPRRGRRRVWAHRGRAHIEVRGLTGHGDRHERLSGALTAAVRAMDGVHWAEVNAVLGQVVVDLDEQQVDADDLLDLVEEIEREQGTDDEDFPGLRPPLPSDTAPAALAKAVLLADVAGLGVAAVRRVVPLRVLPVALRVPAVVAETQPRVRRALEKRLGKQHTDVVLAVSSAAAHALTDGVAAIALDGAQRVWQLAEIRSRQQVWARREHELVRGGKGLHPRIAERLPRPAPLPPGPVEICADRTSLAGLAGAGGLLVWTGDPGRSARALLATVPKAAGMGREAFSAWLGRDLARLGVVPMNGNALRVLDRVTTVVIDSAALCAASPRLLSAVAGDDLDEAGVWSAAQSVLSGRPAAELAGAGPWSGNGWRLRRVRGSRPGRPGAALRDGLPLELLGPDGGKRGEVVVTYDLDPLAEAVMAAARSAAGRLILTGHAAVRELLPWADRVLDGAASLTSEVRALQADGEVVLLVSAHADHALAAADLGVGVLTRAGTAERVCWSADLVCGPGLAEVWRVLTATGEARHVSRRSAHLSVGGSVLGALLAATGSDARRGVAGLTTSPVHGAALLAQAGGVGTARRLARRTPPPPRVRGAWHALGARETLAVLHTVSGRPATAAAAPTPDPAVARARRLLVDGAQYAARVTGTGPAVRAGVQLAGAVREELRDPLTPVLALGAAASAAVGSTVDSALVGGVMAGNALISGAQRLRAQRALSGLLLAERVSARRLRWEPPQGPVTGDRSRFFAGLARAGTDTVAADDLRVGDVIALGPADIVPADARLLVADRLEVDEASLTGEPTPVAKDPAAAPGAELAERTCMVYQGCTVLSGTGYAVVVATGAHTEAGRAAELAGAAGVPTGLEGHLAELTRVALPAVGVGGAAVTMFGLLRGTPVRQALASGVAVAVAAVPEGLPLVATVAQSAAARRLSRHGVLTRSARVLEALGRVDVVAYDKTGTLTEGRLAVTRAASCEHEVDLAGPGGLILLRTAARACPRPGTGGRLAHATDQAVVDAAAAHCPPDDAWRVTAELPFEASRGFSATAGTDAGRPGLAVKGAPETVLARCSAVVGDPGAAAVPLDAGRRRAAQDVVRRLADDGLRVLAVAQASPGRAATEPDLRPEGIDGLTLLGFLAISDPARPGAAETVKRLSHAGVRIAMITGDHPATAAAVARDLGIQVAGVVTGAELDALAEPDRIARTAASAVFARMSPEHKVRVVHDLQRAGHVVAMAGDGVNDAAAIRMADVGIGLSAYGSGAARAAADLVLTDPAPDRLLYALVEGRTLWRSVRDAVGILVGGNAGEVAFTVLGTALSGRAPLSTRQLLLVNLLTDMLPALAVAVAPARPSTAGADPLAGGPAPGLLGPDLARVLAVRGGATTLGAAGAWQIGRMTGRGKRADTMGLAALVGTQLGQTLITDWHSPLVLSTAGISTAVLVAVVQTPGVSQFFGCTPLGPVAWAAVTGCSATATVAAALAPRVATALRSE